MMLRATAAPSAYKGQGMSRSINSRAETMKKTMARFKMPFRASAGGIFVGPGKIVEDKNRNPIGEADTTETAELITSALNFYYAKKGEKE